MEVHEIENSILEIISPHCVELWQYRLWSFQEGVTRLERFLIKINRSQMKLLNFENWSSGELSELGIILEK